MKIASLAIFSVLLSALVGSSHAASASGFVCERMKEKPVRQACIQDRQAKEESENAERTRTALAEKEKIALIEKERAESDQKQKELDDFVNKSKEALTKSFKDPSSAQLSDLTVASNEQRKLLCGMINAKNSYGGYVGAKKFYVAWPASRPDEPEVWTEGDWYSRANAKVDQLISRSKGGGLSDQINAATEAESVVKSYTEREKQALKTATDGCVPSPTNNVAKVGK